MTAQPSRPGRFWERLHFDDGAKTAFSIVHSPVELRGVPTNSLTDDGRVQSYTGYETSVHNGNAGLDDLTATDPAIIIPSELQRGTVEEVKKPDLGKASLKTGATYLSREAVDLSGT
jgi:hypothetical protein